MKYLPLLLLTFLFNTGYAQQQNEYSKADAIISTIPDSSRNSTTSIARFIEVHFNNPNERARAIFVWLANNIQYDVANMYNVNFNLNALEIINKTLMEKKAICQGYAEVYHDIAEKLGIKNYVIEGYTKQNGRVDFLPHAWIAVFLDTTWTFIDPTWGSGNIQKGKYVKQLNNFYFRTSPEKNISTHIPFDPLFEFLYYPVTNQEFSEDNTKIDVNKPYFNYKDTLRQYESLSDIKKLLASARRIEGNGVNNALIFDRLQYIRREADYQHNKTVVEAYNSSVANFNLAVSLLNHFIDYRNRQFQPTKPDPVIKSMIDTVENLLASVHAKLSSIQNPDKANADAIISMKKNMAEVKENLEDQKAFLHKYLNTSKVFRKSLFYNYSRKRKI